MALFLDRIRLYRTLMNACRAGQLPGRALRSFAQREGLSSAADMAAELEAGGTFSNAMRKRPDQFPLWQIEIVAVGESTGRLDQSFGMIAASLEETRAFWLSVLPKLAYPAFLIHLAPFALQIGSLTTHGFSTYLVHCAFSLIPLYLGCAVLYLLGRSLSAVPGALRHIPLAGSFVRSGFAHYFSLMVRAGIPIRRAVELAGRAAGLRAGDSGLGRALDKAETGASVAEILGALALFPPEELEFVESSETAGKIDDELRHLAESARERNRSVINAIMYVVPALIMLLVCGFIAWKIVGFYTDLYSKRLGEGILF